MVTMTASRTGRQLQRYNNQGYRQVVGCIPYRFRKTNQGPIVIEELEVLLISSQKSTKMMFPKGGWELDESIEDAASRECIEEAGIYGIVGHQLGIWNFKSKSQPTFHEGHMFPLCVTKELEAWPEQNVRQRVWMSVKEARELCSHEWMIEALDILLPRLTVPQQIKEEEKRAYCSLPVNREDSDGRVLLEKMGIKYNFLAILKYQFHSVVKGYCEFLFSSVRTSKGYCEFLFSSVRTSKGYCEFLFSSVRTSRSYNCLLKIVMVVNEKLLPKVSYLRWKMEWESSSST